MSWLPTPDGVLAFDRDTSVRCVTNLSPAPAELPPHAGLILASGPLAAACAARHVGVAAHLTHEVSGSSAASPARR